MKKTLLLILAATLITTTATAQVPSGMPNAEISTDTGLVNFQPSSPFYFIETTVDSFTQNKSTTLRERASEYREEINNENTDGAKKALNALNNAAEKAPPQAEKGLQRANFVITTTMPNQEVETEKEQTLKKLRQKETALAQQNNEKNKEETEVNLSELPAKANIFN